MGAAPGIRTRVLSAPDREVPIPRGMRKKSPTICGLRTADRLSSHHDSQFSAFSTEVLDRTIQKHNRSSSPFTTLAEQAERKVVIRLRRIYFSKHFYSILRHPKYSIICIGSESCLWSILGLPGSCGYYLTFRLFD